MADIELVIKIDENIYHRIANGFADEDDAPLLEILFKNGTPLPKGHKRLIEDNFEVGPVFDEEGYLVGYRNITQYELNNAPTIVEADKESEDKG